MAQAKLKTVFNAGAGQIARIRSLVRARRYRTPSEFLREAIDDKLAALDRAGLNQQISEYCAKGFADEDRDLIDSQPLGKEP